MGRVKGDTCMIEAGDIKVGGKGGGECSVPVRGGYILLRGEEKW